MSEKTHGQRASEKLYKEGLDSVVLKFTIKGLDEDKKPQDYDFYLIVASFEGRVDLLDLTVSGLYSHNVRALIESAFKMATALLRKGKTIENIADHWAGYSFEPHGVCPQLVEHYGYESPRTASPLDCVAKILKARFLGGTE